MDFWLANTITSLAGIGGVTIMVVSIVRAVMRSPMRKAKAEIYKQQQLGQIRDTRTDEEILKRITNLENLVSFQNEEIRKVSEENEFFRKLLSDESGRQSGS